MWAVIDYDMTFCVSPTCPYIDHCDLSAKILEGQQGTFSFADFSGTCRDYIAYVVSQIEQGEPG